MKKLTLKKTTLSRLNNEAMTNVKGGEPNLDHGTHLSTSPEYCVLAETEGCTTEGNGCKTDITICAC